MWLLALYQVVAEEQGADIARLTGTTQNDIIKEYLSRGTYIFPPGPSVRLTTDLIAYTVARMPKWNPINVCSYHLQEAGATPVQEIAYALCTATAVLDAVRGRVPAEQMGEVVGRISFFVNAGVRFVEEMCKMRAFARLWDTITRERYGIADPARRRFRYGVQVNSLGLTEAQPENNVQRIVLEMLAVTLSRQARARAIQLPAWNEALGLPRPWDQQWSLRIQQVLAYESDLLEYGDLFEGSQVVSSKTEDLIAGAEAEMAEVAELGGMVPAVESGYLKARLVAAHAARRARIESGQDQVVGVNCFQATEPSPLTADTDTAVHNVDPAHELAVLADLAEWCQHRDQPAVLAALGRLKADAARPDVNLMDATLACARAGVTTGEWSFALREVFGEYRAPTGVGAVPAGVGGAAGSSLAAVREAAHATAAEIGAGRLRLLLGKPGLDGHSNGIEQIAVRARDAGFEVIYSGIRLTPAQIAAAAAAEDVHCVGLSILSGGHAELVPDVLGRLRQAGAGDIPVVAGGIIPPADARDLRARGVAAVFTPADFGITAIVGRIVDVIRRAHGLEPVLTMEG
jgi:(2R)-ethylmalonyl-CoA mutase